MHEPYFVQTQQWASFWLLANPIKHSYNVIKIENKNYSLSFLVYQYPWHFGQSFWYVSKGGTLTSNKKADINNWNDIPIYELEILLIKLIQKVNSEAKKQGISYVKYDFEEELVARLELENNDSVLIWLKEKVNSKIIISDKIIQFMATMTLGFNTIQKVYPIEIYDKENLTNLFINTQEFWKKTNNNVKRYTKKSIEKGWIISTEKSSENFEKFYKVYNHTKDIRGFAIQTRVYLEKLYAQDFSKIIILNDQNNEPHCVWFGIQIGDTQTYLYGGNTQISFDSYGQYLVHLVALNLGLARNAKFYDLGGYDQTKGYGKFKENYKGIIRIFSGPFDIPILPLRFKMINFIVYCIKKIMLFGRR